MLLAHHGQSLADYRVFRGEPEFLRSLAGVLGAAKMGDSRAIVAPSTEKRTR